MDAFEVLKTLGVDDLNWSAPKTVFTKVGERVLRTADSTKKSKEAWNKFKPELKQLGFSVRLNETRGTWEVHHWQEPDRAAKDAILASSAALDADIEIPLSDRAREKGFNYFGFQRGGVKFMSERPSTLLADDMGVGKTIQIVGTMNVLQVERALIVCPASMLLTWGRELYTWCSRDLPVYILSAGTKPREVNELTKIVNEFPKFDRGVVVINWDILHKFEDELRSVSWDLAAFDESQYAKSPDARRTHFAFGCKESLKKKRREVAPIRAKVRILASGTPIKNRPIELFTQLNYLDPVAWPSWYKFADRYCGLVKGRFGFDTSGATNIDELANRLRSTFMIRRLKEEVLTDLPEKTRQVVTVASNGHSNLLDREIKAHAAWEAAKDFTAAKSAAFTELAAIRLEVGLAKVPYVLQHVSEVNQKTIIFCRHKEVQRLLAEALAEKGVVIVNGDVNPTKRDEAMQKFQNDPSIQFFIGTIAACGVGLTLTAASYEVFAELEWTPADLDQAEDRAYRQGQKNAVLVHHVVFDGSLDDRMLLTIMSKQRICKRILDTKEAPKTEQPVDTEKLTKELDREIKRKLSGFAEPSMPKQKLDALQLATKMLAGMCDGARTHDGSGFNKFDTNFGHSLASQESWSPNQAKAAFKLVRKYQRQLPAELYETVYGV